MSREAFQIALLRARYEAWERIGEAVRELADTGTCEEAKVVAAENAVAIHNEIASAGAAEYVGYNMSVEKKVIEAFQRFPERS